MFFKVEGIDRKLRKIPLKFEGKPTDLKKNEY
jgi:hypothetical protein